ncbi:hypothetical protein RRG08_014020 [Elysia crispata]|uniref:Uncharacterized protein n=1 Tax=Elysia crispata TaxID=231223 RepID=A0AAE0XF30_9GAST|nr:hypothetical protein RRG08_014020 [Elysia crispata]
MIWVAKKKKKHDPYVEPIYTGVLQSMSAHPVIRTNVVADGNFNKGNEAWVMEEGDEGCCIMLKNRRGHLAKQVICASNPVGIVPSDNFSRNSSGQRIQFQVVLQLKKKIKREIHIAKARRSHA